MLDTYKYECEKCENDMFDTIFRNNKDIDDYLCEHGKLKIALCWNNRIRLYLPTENDKKKKKYIQLDLESNPEYCAFDIFKFMPVDTPFYLFRVKEKIYCVSHPYDSDKPYYYETATSKYVLEIVNLKMLLSDDIKLVELRNGEKYLSVNNYLKNEYNSLELSYYDKNLNNIFKEKDIMKIYSLAKDVLSYDTDKAELIWERKEKIKLNKIESFMIKEIIEDLDTSVNYIKVCCVSLQYYHDDGDRLNSYEKYITDVKFFAKDNIELFSTLIDNVKYFGQLKQSKKYAIDDLEFDC